MWKTVQPMVKQDALPISLLYTVGLKDNLTNVRDDYNYYRGDTGLYDFYTDIWQPETLARSSYTVSTFVPSSKNSYYFFQDNTLLYMRDRETGEYSPATFIDTDEDYAYFEKSFNEEGMTESYQRLLDASENVGTQLSQEQIVYLNEDDGFVYVKKGAPRITESNNLVRNKTDFVEGNATETLPYYTRLSYDPYVNDSGNVIGNCTVVLGNNGKLTLNVCDVDVTKIWEDNNNSGNQRPKTVTYRLYQDNVLFKTVTIGADDCTVSDNGNKWVYTFKDLPFGYDYRVEENAVEGYHTMYSDDTFTIVNSVFFENTVVLDYGLPSQIDGVPAEYEANAKSISLITQNSDLYFGTVAVDGLNIIYTPNTMKWSGHDTVYYRLVFNDDTSIKGVLHVIPATTVYYEENFLTFHNGTSSWQKVGTFDSAARQDGNDAYLYGYDPAYEDDNTFSNGSAMKVNVNDTQPNLVNVGDATWPSASFEFRGTMFDLISYTGAQTGFLSVKVVNADTNKTVKNYGVNTVYEDSDNHGDLYQIPVIRCNLNSYGHYKVTVSVAYNSYFDYNKLGNYDAYIDAVRIYNPVGDIPADEHISAKYELDNESSPVFGHLRDTLVTSSGSFSAIAGASGTMYVSMSDKDNSGGSGTVNVSTYEKNGPNHEVYLENNDAIAFQIPGFSVKQKLHISAKVPNNSSATLVVNGKIVSNVTSGTEQYFDVTDNISDDGVVVVSNAGTGILSLVNYKVTGEQVFNGFKVSMVAFKRSGDYLTSSANLAAPVGKLSTPISFLSRITLNGQEKQFTVNLDLSTYTPKLVDGKWTVIGKIFTDDGRVLEALEEAGWQNAYAKSKTTDFKATWNGTQWVTDTIELEYLSSPGHSNGLISGTDIFQFIINIILGFFRVLFGAKS